MSTTDYDYERCIVSIWINGKVNGTGFVIAPGKVLTCAHVVLETDEELGCEKSRKKKIKIEFYGVPRSQNSDDLPALQPVAIDPDHFSPETENDIAILTWEGDLPKEVTAARFSVEEKLAGRHVRTRGFPVIPPYCSQPGIGTIQGTTTHVTGALHWTLTSQEITGGFSGAPIFDPISGHVVAMVRAVIRPDTHWRNKETAIGISVQTLQTVCGELIRAPEKRSTYEFATDYLNANTVALQVFRELVAPASPAPLTADAIVEKTLKVNEPLDTLLNYLEHDAERSNGVLKKELSDEQCDAIWQICDYATCLALPQKQVDRINEQLAGRKLTANTIDRRLIVIHLATSFNLAKFDSRAATDSNQSISQRRKHGLIATEDHAILSTHGNSDETGAGSNRTLSSPGRNTSSKYTDYQQAFIRGMARQYHLANALSEGIDYLLVQIKDKLKKGKEPGKDPGPVVAVLMTEWREIEIDVLKGFIPEVYFVQLPQESDSEYALIALRREDIFKLIDDHRRKQND